MKGASERTISNENGSNVYECSKALEALPGSLELNDILHQGLRPRSRQLRKNAEQHPNQQHGSETDRMLQQEYFGSSSTFWEQDSNLPVPKFGPKDILIAVMGMTGAGKSTFISNIAGLDMKIGHDLFSCTKKIGVATMVIGDRRIHLIDTPGFDDTEIKDADILEVIALYLSNPSSRRISLSGIIYLHRISDPKVGGTAIKNIRLFRGLVGNKVMSNVVLVTTMWDLVSRPEGESREAQLLNTDDFWGGMVRYGARHDRYDGNRQNGLRIIWALLGNNPGAVQIQEEIAEGASLSDTSAGREVNEHIEKLHGMYKAEIEILKKEVAEAAQANDYEELKTKLFDQERTIEKMNETWQVKEKMLQATIDFQATQVAELHNQGHCLIL